MLDFYIGIKHIPALVVTVSYCFDYQEKCENELNHSKHKTANGKSSLLKFTVAYIGIPYNSLKYHNFEHQDEHCDEFKYLRDEVVSELNACR